MSHRALSSHQFSKKVGGPKVNASRSVSVNEPGTVKTTVSSLKVGKTKLTRRKQTQQSDDGTPLRKTVSTNISRTSTKTAKDKRAKDAPSPSARPPSDGPPVKDYFAEYDAARASERPVESWL